MRNFIEIGDDLVELGCGDEVAFINLDQIDLVSATRNAAGQWEANVFFRGGRQHRFAGALAEQLLARVREEGRDPDAVARGQAASP